ncbi:TrmH family RNA methyltransferase [Actinobacillus porcinus]|uniref:TrmH family RNA methyltransferase n=1 Tax=Actinobacillus porcinus TaxID=51048 RepID=UPI0023F54966|nr:TrmH family RNA methyltransferase [Actinobacillus porcinus]MDD7545416.1 TrmH family RNA methyltransferase [Actinobacillus porcinus]MDY5848008.1 TrmH family RNA methyltransferase [Actinobacillus porcinus]
MTSFKQPKFQISSQENRFKERTFGEGSTRRFNERKAKKQDENSPHFKGKRSTRGSDKSAFAHSQPMTPQITETQLGGVKVVVKSMGAGDKPKVKKTGALSPRAPEKIKKNRAEEMKVFGENACLTLFAERPESIVRAWATVEMSHRIGEMFSYLAANKKAYHVVDRAELELVSGSEHHGGICLLVKKQRPFTLTGYLDIPRQADCLLLLDGVANNPQNIGGIIRTCAFYGIKQVISSEPELLNSPNAFRVAEGGMEYVHPLQAEATDMALSQLRKAGYQIVHLSNEKNAQSASHLKLQDKVVFVLAHADFAEKGDDIVNLSFANPLKSGLNVAVAAGILLSKWVAR